jgi:hypothetical protein
MAALSERIARVVSAHIRGTAPFKNMIILSSIKHIVRCFFFEKTAYANTFYLWSSVVPLFNPMKNISLNYGKRLTTKCTGQLFVEVPEDLDLFGKSLGKLLSESHLQQLLEIDSIDAFLRAFPYDESNERPSIFLDYGVANCLAGRMEMGVRLLERASRSRFGDSFSAQIKSLAAERLSELKEGESVFLAAIEACERDNIAAHFPVDV